MCECALGRERVRVCVCVWGPTLAKTQLISTYLFAEYETLRRLLFRFVESEMEMSQQGRQTRPKALNGARVKIHGPKASGLSSPCQALILNTRRHKYRAQLCTHRASCGCSHSAKRLYLTSLSRLCLVGPPPFPEGKAYLLGEGPRLEAVDNFPRGQALPLWTLSRARREDLCWKSVTFYFLPKGRSPQIVSSFGIWEDGLSGENDHLPNQICLALRPGRLPETWMATWTQVD